MTITHSPMGVLHLASSVVAMLVGGWFVLRFCSRSTGSGAYPFPAWKIEYGCIYRHFQCDVFESTWIQKISGTMAPTVFTNFGKSYFKLNFFTLNSIIL